MGPCGDNWPLPEGELFFASLSPGRGSVFFFLVFFIRVVMLYMCVFRGQLQDDMKMVSVELISFILEPVVEGCRNFLVVEVIFMALRMATAGVSKVLYLSIGFLQSTTKLSCKSPKSNIQKSNIQ